MKFIILTLAALVACASAASIFDSRLDESWVQFKSVFSKSYKHVKEESLRRVIFEKNLDFINKHNLEFGLGKSTFSVKMNKFGDLTSQEFAKQFNGFNKTKKMQSKSGAHFSAPSNVKIPDSVDWRTQGKVTPIKNQGQCGSCWAFSAVGSLEGVHAIASGQLVSLSEQQLVDCSGSYGNQGCNGGLMDQAFQYIIDNKGIDTEESYPYNGGDGTCKFNPNTVGATMKAFTDITSGDEAALTNAIFTVGPIASAVDASQASFQFYSSGVYSDPACSPDQIDHGTTIIGYGTLAGVDYYILKNMWGTNWGDNGFMLLARNQKNMCGIASMASFPIV